MKILSILATCMFLVAPTKQRHFASGFVVASTRTAVSAPGSIKIRDQRLLVKASVHHDNSESTETETLEPVEVTFPLQQESLPFPTAISTLPTAAATLVLIWNIAADPAQAFSSCSTSSTTLVAATPGGVLPSALYAYGHFFSIMAITGCLAAERVLIKADMSVEEEELVVRLDLVYGLLAALLIGSGVLRANANGDFYIHEVLFWVKMAVSGIWGGLSIFPSLTFYKRNFARKNNELVEPLSDKLAARVHQIINAELLAILTIPVLATLMARGVSYWQDLPWQVGLLTAIACTAGSFFFYGKQALSWQEE